MTLKKIIINNDDVPNFLIFFPDNAAPEVDDLEVFHNNIKFYLAIILFAVSWTVLSKTLNDRYAKPSDRWTYYELLVKVTKFSMLALVILWIAFPCIKAWNLMDKLMGFESGEELAVLINSIFNDALLMSTGELEQVEPLAEIDFSKFFMNDQNSRGFRNRISDIIWPTYHYQHGRTNYLYDPTLPSFHTRVNNLRDRAEAMGFFSISNIDRLNRSIDVTYFQPVPSLDETAKLDLLEELVRLFPYGDGYNLPTGDTLDDYRMQGHLHSILRGANDHPDWTYRANQNKPVGISPYYDPNRPRGYYGAWPKDIAASMSRYKADNNTIYGSKVILDRDSSIFLSTFRNATLRLSPINSFRGDGPIITQLNSL